jgi:hypothetical protein
VLGLAGGVDGELQGFVKAGAHPGVHGEREGRVHRRVRNRAEDRAWHCYVPTHDVSGAGTLLLLLAVAEERVFVRVVEVGLELGAPIG